jgi:hypothetical protein
MRSKPGCAFSRRYPALYLVRAIFVRLGDLAMLTSVLRISLWVLTPKWPCSCRPTSRSRYLRESASAPDPQPKTLARGHAHSGGSENRTRTRQKQQSGTSIKWNRLLPCEPEIRSRIHVCQPDRANVPVWVRTGPLGPPQWRRSGKGSAVSPAPPSDRSSICDLASFRFRVRETVSPQSIRRAGDSFAPIAIVGAGLLQVDVRRHPLNWRKTAPSEAISPQHSRSNALTFQWVAMATRD